MERGKNNYLFWKGESLIVLAVTWFPSKRKQIHFNAKGFCFFPPLQACTSMHSCKHCEQRHTYILGILLDSCKGLCIYKKIRPEVFTNWNPLYLKLATITFSFFFFFLFCLWLNFLILSGSYSSVFLKVVSPIRWHQNIIVFK